jgi:head-tail adaptor
MIPAGELREAVIVQIPVKTTNVYGEEIIEWQDFAKRRAKIGGRTISELSLSDAQFTSGRYDVTFRYLQGLTAEMRLVWVSRSPQRALDIVAITEKGFKEDHELVCKEFKA